MADSHAHETPSSTIDLALQRLALLGAGAHAFFLPISTAGMQIGLAVAFGALLLLRLRGRRVWARGPLDAPSLLLAGAALLSVAVAAALGSPPTDWHKATSWFILLSPVVLFSTVRAASTEAEIHRRAAWVLGAWALGALAPSALAWVQISMPFDPLYALHLRKAPVLAPAPLTEGRFAAVGFFRWYTVLALNLLPPVCLAVSLALFRGLPRAQRAVLAGVALAAGAAILLTVSRAAWASLVLGVLAAVLLGGRGWRWALALVLAAAIGMAAQPSLRARFLAIGEREAISDRELVWKVCGAMVRDRPLTGWGWGNVPARSAPYYERLAPEFPLHAWCHDSFFTAWAEGGPLLAGALAAWWALVFAAFWRWRRAGGLARAASAGALAALAAMLVNSLFHDILHSAESSLGLLFVVGVAAALAMPAGAATRVRSQQPETGP
jgi:O-antigen ligase